MQQDSNRYFFFDNARALLVLLVIFGHFIEPIRNANPVARTLYLTIYTFHVPALVFISGFFSRKYGRESKQSDLLRRFLVPYLLAQILLYVSGKYLFGLTMKAFDIFKPMHALWYLLSLFLWYVMLSYVLRLRFPLVVSIGVALLVGYSERIGLPFSFSRTFVFFPFFLAGYYLDISHIKRLKLKAFQITSIMFFLLLVVVFYVTGHQIDDRWLLGIYSYGTLDHNEWYAFIFRLAVLALSFTGTMAFLSLLPERKFLFTQTGQRSIYPYVLHVFVFYWHAKAKLFYGGLGHYTLPAIFAFSLAIYLVFSSKLAVWATRPVIEPKLRFLFK